MNADLQLFVREALSRGFARPTIADQLRQAGWRPEEIEAGLAAYADLDFPVPVPRRHPYLSAREAFLYLVLFATLYTTAFNVGVVLFQWTDHALPDPGQRWESARTGIDAVRGATAGLIIAFPVFLLLTGAIGRSIAKEPEKRGSKIRKWLTYLTLFVAAMVLIGDLTFLVSRLLAGELPLRVLLKVAVVFAIAGTVFGHYLGELRRDEHEGAVPARELRMPPRLAGVAVLVVLVAGLVLGGSPARERRRQLDARRLEDLQNISGAIETYAARHEGLPAGLEGVIGQPDAGWIRFQDPVSGERYAYRALDSLRYELCATFDAADSAGADGVAAFWRHPQGRTCFTFDAPRLARGHRRPPAPLRAPERGP